MLFRSKSKLFRRGGDEFNLHVPDHESAVRFARVVRQKLNNTVPIGGTHKLSMSIGIGHSPAHAEQALIHAKGDKKAQNYTPGQAGFHAHSLVPGNEGKIPLESDNSLKLAVR